MDHARDPWDGNKRGDDPREREGGRHDRTAARQPLNGDRNGDGHDDSPYRRRLYVRAAVPSDLVVGGAVQAQGADQPIGKEDRESTDPPLTDADWRSV